MFKNKVFYLKFFIAFVLFCVLLFFSFGFQFVSIATNANYKCLDFFQSFNSNSSNYAKNVVIAVIDEKSVVEFENLKTPIKWPWPQSIYAQAIAYMSEGGARQIIFQDELSSISENSGENLFSATLNKYKNVTLGFSLLNYSQPEIGLNVLTPKIVVKENTVKEFLGVARFDENYHNENVNTGFINCSKDFDGAIRTYYPLAKVENKIYPSIAFAAYMKEVGQLDTLDKLQSEKGNLILNKNSSIDYVEFIDIVKSYASESISSPSIIDSSFFNNKIIFVANSYDHYNRSFAQHNNLLKYNHENLEVHARAFLNFVKNDFKTEINYLYIVLYEIFFIAVFLLIALLLKRKLFLFAYFTTYLISVIAPIFIIIFTGYQFNILSIFFINTISVVVLVLMKNFFFNLEFKKVYDTFEKSLSKNSLINMLDEWKVKNQYKKNISTVLVVDIKDFYNFISKNTPKDVISISKKFYTEAESIIKENGGFIYKNIETKIIAFFGNFDNNDSQIYSAVDVSEKILKKLFWLKKDYNLSVKIGVHNGEILQYNTSNKNIIDYAAIGPVIYNANRLCNLNDVLQTNILLSDAVFRVIMGKFNFCLCGRFLIDGEKEPEKLYFYNNFPENYISVWTNLVRAIELKNYDSYEKCINIFMHSEIIFGPAAYMVAMKIQGVDIAKNGYLLIK